MSTATYGLGNLAVKHISYSLTLKESCPLKLAKPPVNVILTDDKRELNKTIEIYFISFYLSMHHTSIGIIYCKILRIT